MEYIMFYFKISIYTILLMILKSLVNIILTAAYL